MLIYDDNLFLHLQWITDNKDGRYSDRGKFLIRFIVKTYGYFFLFYVSICVKEGSLFCSICAK